MTTEAPNTPRQVFDDRYPGIRPFKKDEATLFFGRDTEIEELLHAIKVHDTLVLYGKSGLGKSSLVNAGLVPRLLEESLFPIDIRFLRPTDTNPYKKILSEVKAFIPDETLKAIPEKLQENLWVVMNRWQKPNVPILIFDQFEEFFYYPQAFQAEAISEIAGLINTKVSEHVVRKITAAHHDNEQFALNLLKKPAVKLLFLIRSDKISLLEAFSTKLPQILSNRYQLKPLGIEKAEQAISLPAQLNASDFATYTSPAYEYSMKSLKIILDKLDNDNGEVESSQLQIVCQELEKIAEKKRSNTDREIVIEPADFGGEEGIEKIISEFYWNQLDKLKTNEGLQLTDGDMNIVRSLIEDELLSDNTRTIQPAGRVKKFLGGVKPGVQTIGNIEKETFLIDELLRLRLIREEDSNWGKVFEISHDTLVDSIVKAREERLKRKQEEELVEQQKQLEAARQEAREQMALREEAVEAKERAGRNLKVAKLVAALAIVGGVIALYFYKVAREEKARATTALEEAKMHQEITKASRIKSYADSYTLLDEDSLARANYDSAQKILAPFAKHPAANAIYKDIQSRLTIPE